MASPLSFTGFVWQNMRERHLRTLPTLGGMNMANGAIVVLVGLSGAFAQSWQSIDASCGIDTAMIRQALRNMPMDEGAGAKLKALPEWLGVKLSRVEALRHA